jgi:hypothetical protein
MEADRMVQKAMDEYQKTTSALANLSKQLNKNDVHANNNIASGGLKIASLVDQLKSSPALQKVNNATNKTEPAKLTAEMVVSNVLAKAAPTPVITTHDSVIQRSIELAKKAATKKAHPFTGLFDSVSAVGSDLAKTQEHVDNRTPE